MVVVICGLFLFYARRATQLMKEDDDAAVPYCASLGDAAKVLPLKKKNFPFFVQCRELTPDRIVIIALDHLYYYG